MVEAKKSTLKILFYDEWNSILLWKISNYIEYVGRQRRYILKYGTFSISTPEKWYKIKISGPYGRWNGPRNGHSELLAAANILK